MYKVPKYSKSLIKSIDIVEGETIEMKVRRMVHSKEPIKDGAPLIYTDKKDGVVKGYDVRTDRWEVAAEAMDKVTAAKVAKSEGKAKMEVSKGGSEEPGDGGAESIQGTGQ